MGDRRLESVERNARDQIWAASYYLAFVGHLNKVRLFGSEKTAIRSGGGKNDQITMNAIYPVCFVYAFDRRVDDES
jgi:hypothetical protein